MLGHGYDQHSPLGILWRLLDRHCLHVVSPGWQPSAAQSSAHFDAVAATSSKENVAAFNIKAVMAGDRSFDLKV